MEKIPKNTAEEANIPEHEGLVERAQKYTRIAAFTSLIAASESVAQEPQKVENAKEIPQTSAGEIFKKFESHQLTSLERGIVAKIETYNPGDFKRVGIYIRQDHLWPENSEQMKKSSKAQKAKHLDSVSDFQEQLPHILDWVHEKSGATNVRIEGIDEIEAPGVKAAWEDPDIALGLSAKFGGPIISSTYGIPEKNMPLEFKNMYGGLVTEEIVANKPWSTILPGEKKEVIDRVDEIGTKYSGISDEAFQKLSKEERDKFFELVMEEREDALVSMLSKDDGYATILVYGAGHDFTRAFIEHNNANPENKHALVIITPECLKDCTYVVETEEKQKADK